MMGGGGGWGGDIFEGPLLVIGFEDPIFGSDCAGRGGYGCGAYVKKLGSP